MLFATILEVLVVNLTGALHSTNSVESRRARNRRYESTSLNVEVSCVAHLGI
jgi:hypothetical protein